MPGGTEFLSYLLRVHQPTSKQSSRSNTSAMASLQTDEFLPPKADGF